MARRTVIVSEPDTKKIMTHISFFRNIVITGYFITVEVAVN